jgi:hypothetical protein
MPIQAITCPADQADRLEALALALGIKGVEMRPRASADPDREIVIHEVLSELVEGAADARRLAAVLGEGLAYSVRITCGVAELFLGIDPAPPTTTGATMTTTHNDQRALDLIDRLHTYHPPQGDQAQRYQRISTAAEIFALVLAECCPGSPELTIAIRDVANARMHANQAIAVNEPRLADAT